MSRDLPGRSKTTAWRFEALEVVPAYNSGTTSRASKRPERTFERPGSLATCCKIFQYLRRLQLLNHRQKGREEPITIHLNQSIQSRIGLVTVQFKVLDHPPKLIRLSRLPLNAS